MIGKHLRRFRLEMDEEDFYQEERELSQRQCRALRVAALLVLTAYGLFVYVKSGLLCGDDVLSPFTVGFMAHLLSGAGTCVLYGMLLWWMWKWAQCPHLTGIMAVAMQGVYHLVAALGCVTAFAGSLRTLTYGMFVLSLLADLLWGLSVLWVQLAPAFVASPLIGDTLHLYDKVRGSFVLLLLSVVFAGAYLFIPFGTGVSFGLSMAFSVGFVISLLRILTP